MFVSSLTSVGAAISPGVYDYGTYNGVGVIYNYDSGNFSWVEGSGVAISDRHLLTAWHVVNEQNNENDPLPASKVGFRPTNDDIDAIHPLYPADRPSLQSPPWSNDLAILTFPANTFETWYAVDFRENVLGLELVIVGAGRKGRLIDPPNWHVWELDEVATRGVVRWGTNEIQGYVQTSGWPTYERWYALMDEDTDHESCVCPHDSGGPSLNWDDSQYKIIGIHHTGGTTAGFGGGAVSDIRMYYYKDWIESFLGEDNSLTQAMARVGIAAN